MAWSDASRAAAQEARRRKHSGAKAIPKMIARPKVPSHKGPPRAAPLKMLADSIKQALRPQWAQTTRTMSVKARWATKRKGK